MNSTEYPFNENNTNVEYEEIPFPLARTIAYTGNVIIFKCDYQKIKEQLDCYNSNKNWLRDQN